MVPMRDGTKLSTYLYRPHGPAPGRCSMNSAMPTSAGRRTKGPMPG